MCKYVLITPAKNEEANIEKTVQSVIAQTLKPSRWIIVEDGSTDRTAAIVSKYLSSYPFITLRRIETSCERNFGKKVAAFNEGLKLLNAMEYSFIGNLDADMSFAPNYYESVIAEFRKDPSLGIAGGVVYTKIGQRFVTDDTAPDSVGGALQLFRTECFEEIGGYVPLEHGGIDAAAEILARMKGWTVRKFSENRAYEHRRTGSAGNGLATAKFREGVKFYSLGYSTIFYCLRSFFKMKSRPYLLGSTLSLMGFMWAKMRNYPIVLSPEAVTYLRAEQVSKLKRLLHKGVGGARAAR